MINVRDSKGFYEIGFDTNRRISYEKNSGFWKKEDMDRYHGEYTKKLPMELKNKSWAICCDLREYKTSSISDEMNLHVQWKLSVGMKCAAVLVNDPIVAMQMNRAAGNKYPQKAFTNMNEADAWLRSQGF